MPHCELKWEMSVFYLFELKNFRWPVFLIYNRLHMVLLVFFIPNKRLQIPPFRAIIIAQARLNARVEIKRRKQYEP